MRTRIKRPFLLLPGLIAVMLLTLSVLPWTGWLVRSQAAMCLWSADALGRDTHLLEGDADNREGAPAVEQRALSRAASRLPNDYQIQLAAAVITRGDGDSPLQITLSSDVPEDCYRNLRALRTRFPQNASLDANLLRYAATHEMAIHRTDWNALFSRPGSAVARPVYQEQPPTLAQFAAFESAANEGERLEPDNAYFSLLHAAGLFAVHHDRAALDALHRAALKTRWDDHVHEEILGDWRLRELAFGDRSAWGREMEETGFPDNDLLRGTAHTATFLAMQAEQRGQIAQGIAIRHDLLRSFSVMRAEAHDLSRSVTATTLFETVLARPGGMPVPQPSGMLMTHQDHIRERQAAMSRYCAYLNQRGLAQEVRCVQAEEAATEQTLALINRADTDAPIRRTFGWLLLLWPAGLLLLSNALWLLVLTGVAAGAIRLPRLRAEQPLPGPARWGAFVGIAASAVAGYVWTSNILWEIDARKLFWSLAESTAALLFLLGLAYCLRWRTLREALGWFLLVVGGLVGWYALAAWQTRFLQAGIEFYENTGWRSLPISLGPNGKEWLSVIGALCTPLQLLLGLVIASLIRRVPVSVGITVGFRRFALPLACFLLFIYSGLAVETARLEAVASGTQAAILRQPDTYYAAIFGQSWPGPVQ